MSWAEQQAAIQAEVLSRSDLPNRVSELEAEMDALVDVVLS